MNADEQRGAPGGEPPGAEGRGAEGGGLGESGPPASAAPETAPSAPFPDAELIARTWRLVGDPESADGILEAWDACLGEDGARIADRAALDENILSATAALWRMQPRPDPAGELLGEPGVAAAILCKGRVQAANPLWTERFGHAAGSEAGTGWLHPESLSVHAALIARRPPPPSGPGSSNGSGSEDARALLRLLDGGTRPVLAEAWPLSPEAGPAPDGGRGGTAAPRIAVRLLEPGWPLSMTARLREAFGLTETECAVCEGLAGGLDPAAQAARRGVSVRTVRGQLSAVFSKTGTTSQAELARLLVLLATRLRRAEPGPAAPDAWTDPMGREETFEAQGRTLAWSRIGARDGVPWLLLHGPAVGYALPRGADEAYRRSGITLYALQRPGHGHSGPLPELSPAEDGALAAEALLDRLGLARAGGIALHNGAVPLLALAARAPERLAALHWMGLASAVREPGGLDGANRAERVLMRLVQHLPSAARLLTDSSIRNVRTLGADWYVQRAFDLITDPGADQARREALAADVAFLSSAAGLAQVRNAVLLMAHQGTDAFIRDLSLSVERLLPLLAAAEAARIPLTLWAGMADGRATARRLKSLRGAAPSLEVRAAAGSQGLLWYRFQNELRGALERDAARTRLEAVPLKVLPAPAPSPPPPTACPAPVPPPG